MIDRSYSESDHMNHYPRYVTNNFRNFDPVALATDTERFVRKGNSRKYTGFSISTEYGGIVTGYVVGCCLRCVFCWANKSRDFPEEYGNYYSPRDAFKKMRDVAMRNKMKTLRLSGAEPTLVKEHLLEFLTYVENSDFNFILETNGIPLAEESYAKQISKFKKLQEIDPLLTMNLDEETLLPFPHSLERLRYAGFQTWYFRFPFTAANLLRKTPNTKIRQAAKRAMYLLFSKRRQARIP